jgi:hypothetical protein
MIPPNAVIGPNEPLHWWYRLVEQYQRRAITRVEDRLPAIGGLAQHFAERLSIEYIAGLWKNDILRGLLWMRVGDEALPAPEHIRSNPKAPTWSWAHSEFAVGYHFEPYDRPTHLPWRRIGLHKDQDLLIERFSLEAAHGPFGEVDHASIETRSQMLPLELEEGLETLVHGRPLKCQFDRRPSSNALWLALVGAWVDELLDVRLFFLILERLDKHRALYQRTGLGWISSESHRSLTTAQLTTHARRHAEEVLQHARRTRIVIL